MSPGSLASVVTESRVRLLSSPPADSHLVHFYEDEAFLVRAVSDYLAAGLRAGETVIVVATEARRESFREGLAGADLDVDEACRSGQLTLLDARETLSLFMVDGMPDRGRFQTHVSDLLGRCRAQGAPVRAYGEMVDLLWREGNAGAALRLEALWNDLGRAQSFTLLCAYLMGNFHRESHGAPFRDVCDVHSHVLPVEPVRGVYSNDLLREMSVLQQRARALENEIAHRKELEDALRDALAERRRIEEALRAQNEELARTVRFSELFVGILGHDLRNPLSAVTTAASLLVRRAESERVSRPAARILSSGQRMSRMIDQLLDLTRIRLGKGIPLGRARIDLAEICRMAVDELDPATEVPRVRVSCEGDLVGWWDGDRLSQLLSNLIGNALAHGDRNVPVTIHLKGESEQVSVEVGNGGSIPSEVLPGIFDPAKPGLNLKREGSSGLGLGLYISQQIVLAHAGTMEVVSSAEQGTTFTVQLPRNLHQAKLAFGPG